jgi:integral membrane sensor domain MASE1
VETPPKINEVPPKVVTLEVMPPEPARSVPPPPASEGPPIHALSALILVAVDSLWIPAEFLPPIWFFAVPACFVATIVPTFLIQKYLKHDTTGRALAFASVLAVLAAIPTPIMGGPVGLGLLAWTGLGKLLGRGTPK